MGRKHSGNVLNYLILGGKGDRNTQTRIRVIERVSAVACEKDRYIFSSVYPSEAIMNRAESIMRAHKEKNYNPG